MTGDAMVFIVVRALLPGGAVDVELQPDWPWSGPGPD